MQKFDRKLFSELLNRLRRLKNPHKLPINLFKGDYISSNIKGKYTLNACTISERISLLEKLKKDVEKELELKRLAELRKKL